MPHSAWESLKKTQARQLNAPAWYFRSLLEVLFGELRFGFHRLLPAAAGLVLVA